MNSVSSPQSFTVRNLSYRNVGNGNSVRCKDLSIVLEIAYRVGFLNWKTSFSPTLIIYSI